MQVHAPSRRLVMITRVPTFETKYSDEQREAVAIAYLDRRVRPAMLVVQLAARGELPHGDGVLEPFQITEDSVRTYAARLRKARNGTLKAGLTDAAPKDAIEQLRRRLVSASDHMLDAVERRQRRGLNSPKDPELLRQIARAVREIAALPGPDDPRPVQPGQKVPGTGANNGDRTKGGLAGTILAAHSGKGDVYTQGEDPHQSPSQDTEQHGEHSAAQQSEDDGEHRGSDGPGAWMSEQVAMVPDTGV